MAGLVVLVTLQITNMIHANVYAIKKLPAAQILYSRTSTIMTVHAIVTQCVHLTNRTKSGAIVFVYLN